MKSYLLAFLAFVFVAACQNETATPVKANFFIRYDQMEQKIKAEATFSAEKSGSKVWQGGVAFVGSGMETHTLPGEIVRYETERLMRLPEELAFRFKDERGREQNFSTQIAPIISFRIEGASIQKSKSFSLLFDAKPLTANEKLVLAFTDAKNQALNIEINGPTEKQEIIIPPSQIASLATGAARLYLVRTNHETRQEKGYEVNFQTEFYSDVAVFEIEN